MGTGKPPFKGELSVFRVGRTGESLLNVHKAVEAFEKKKKHARSKAFEVTDGIACLTPTQFLDHLPKAIPTRLRSGTLHTVKITDPLTDLEAVFTTVKTDDMNPTVKIPSHQVRINGISTSLRNNQCIEIVDDRQYHIGYLLRTADLPKELAASDVKTTSSTIINLTTQKFLPSAALDANQTLYSNLRSSTLLRALVDGIKRSNQYIDLIQFDPQRGHVAAARLWRPDMNDQPYNVISLNDTQDRPEMRTLNPVRLALLDTHARIQEVLAIMTPLDFEPDAATPVIDKPYGQIKPLPKRISAYSVADLRRAVGQLENPEQTKTLSNRKDEIISLHRPDAPVMAGITMDWSAFQVACSKRRLRLIFNGGAGGVGIEAPRVDQDGRIKYPETMEIIAILRAPDLNHF